MVLNKIYKSAFGPSEQNEPNEKEDRSESDGYDRLQRCDAGNTEKKASKVFHDRPNGVKIHYPAEVLGEPRRGINDGRCIHPDLEEKAH
jgi:hypothetical protein